MTKKRYNWHFTDEQLSNTPSRLDNITFENERRYRYDGCAFIKDMGRQLNLHYNTVATGTVYFHRFYMMHSFRDFPRFPTAACCLFLAGKAEETPKKIANILALSQELLSETRFATFGNDPKDFLFTMEKILLQTIRFDLSVEHPYQHLLKYNKCFNIPKQIHDKILQIAWTFTNDRLVGYFFLCNRG